MGFNLKDFYLKSHSDGKYKGARQHLDGMTKRLQMKRSIENFLSQAVQLRDAYQNKSILNLVNECINLQQQQEKRRLLREADDAVFRAYYRESGIRNKLQSFVDFVEEQLDGIDNLEVIHRCAYNSILDMAAYQLRNLEAEREKLNGRSIEKISVEEFYRQFGMDNPEKKINFIGKELKELRSHIDEEEADLEVLDRQLRLISDELELLNPNEVQSRLENIRQSLNKKAGEKEAENDELYQAIQKILSSDECKNTAQTEGLTLEEYKKRLIIFADQVETAVLSKWPQI